MLVQWITIRVRDFEAAKQFYGTFLGLELTQSFAPSPNMRIAFYGNPGETQIELISDDNHPLPPVTPNAVSIGIATDRYESILTAARSEALLTREPEIIGGHMECFFLTDPDGTGIQLIKPNT